MRSITCLAARICDRMARAHNAVTKFAVAPDEEQLNNLTLWLDQTEFRGFEKVDYRFEYSRDGTIRCHVPGDLPTARITSLSSAIDLALTRIVSELGPRTEPVPSGL